jgi:hypothetical protein
MIRYGCFESFPFRKNFCYFRPPDHVILMECIALDFRCQCTQQKLQLICAVLMFDLQLKKILTFSVKDRYQLNYFICIKHLNTETITSLKLNLFSFLICCCQHHERKMICLYIFLISDRYWVLNISIYSAVSIFQLLIIYRIYNYEMLTLLQ